MTIRLKIHSSSSQIKVKNVVGIHLPTTAGVCSIIHRQQIGSPCRRRREPFRRKMLLLNGSSLPLSRLFNTPYYNSIDPTYSQIPFILPHSTWISSLPEKMSVDSNPPRGITVNSHSRIRGFSGVSDFGEDEIKGVKSLADEKKVESVCKVIDELFALDRNMENVLDDFRVTGFGNQRIILFLLIKKCDFKVGIFLLMKKYKNMLNCGCMSDVAGYTFLITGFGNQKQMDKVYGLLKEMKEKGCPSDGRMYNDLIKLMTNHQMPDDAVRIYKKMIQNEIEPTINTYNMMLKSFLKTENYDMGVAVWEEMSQKGVCPDDNLYIVFVRGLIRQGISMESCKYLEEMIEKVAQKIRFECKIEVSVVCSRYADTVMKETGKGFNFVRN